MSKKKRNRGADLSSPLLLSNDNQVIVSESVESSQPAKNGWFAYLKNHYWAVGIIAFLSLGILGSGLSYLETDAVRQKANNETPASNQANQSWLNRINPFIAAPLPTSTPTLSKEYIYAGSRLLAVEDANASVLPTPTPGNSCTPTTTVTEGDLSPGGISSFGVSSGAGTVTIDSINSGTGLQSFTLVSATNATVNIPTFMSGTYEPVTATFTAVDSSQAVDFTLRAANTYHAIFVRVQCVQTCIPTATVTEGDLSAGGISSFGVSSGAGSVTVDSINSGTGLQSYTVVSATNATVNIPTFTLGTYEPVTATYTISDSTQPVDFTLRAANTYHAVFIRVRCSTSLNTFNGRATAVNATINGANSTLADTGELPTAGGSITATPLMSSNVLGGALTTGLLNANTQAAGEQSRSQATVETLNLLAGGNTITADIAASSSQCTCTTGGPVCQGSIQIGNLRVNGVQIAIVDQAVNQTVNLTGGGTLIYNEQIRTGAGNNAGITNNGLHVSIPDTADVIISAAHSDITCATP